MSEEMAKWETLSTSTSGVDRPHPHDAHLGRLACDTFDRTAEYLRGECADTLAHYALLEEMNRLALNKYSDMRRVTADLQRCVAEHGEARAASVEPHLRHLDLIEESLAKLERAAYSLDNYTKLLHVKFQNISKRF